MPFTDVIHVVVKKSKLPFAGNGVFACKAIRKGTCVWSPGPVFTADDIIEIDDWFEEEGPHNSADLRVHRSMLVHMEQAQKYFPWLDAHHCRTMACHIKWHGWPSEPGYIMVDVDKSRFLNCVDGGTHTITFNTPDGSGVAVRDIVRGEELTFESVGVYVSTPHYIHDPVAVLRQMHANCPKFLTSTVRSFTPRELARILA